MTEQPRSDDPSKLKKPRETASQTDGGKSNTGSFVLSGSVQQVWVRQGDGSYIEDPVPPPPLPTSIPVSIFLTNEGINGIVEDVVRDWLATADVFVTRRGKAVIGSWLLHLWAKAQKTANTPAAQEAALTAIHMADSHLVQTQDAYVTATLLQNVGPVLQSLQPTKDALVRAGALLIVKIDWEVQVHQLTAVQQATLDHQPRLLASPKEIVTALLLSSPSAQEAAPPSSASPSVGGETVSAAD